MNDRVTVNLSFELSLERLATIFGAAAPAGFAAVLEEAENANAAAPAPAPEPEATQAPTRAARGARAARAAQADPEPQAANGKAKSLDEPEMRALLSRVSAVDPAKVAKVVSILQTHGGARRLNECPKETWPAIAAAAEEAIAAAGGD